MMMASVEEPGFGFAGDTRASSRVGRPPNSAEEYPISYWQGGPLPAGGGEYCRTRAPRSVHASTITTEEIGCGWDRHGVILTYKLLGVLYSRPATMDRI